MVYWLSKKFTRPLHGQTIKWVHYLYPFISMAFPSKIHHMKKGRFSNLAKFQFGVLLTMLIVFSGCASAPKWMQGTWQGTGNQVDGQQWEVSLDATKLSKVKIEYPDLSCGGEWKLVKKAENGANIREKLTYGLDKCDQNVEVILARVSAEQLKVEYYLKSYSDNAIATAILTRSRE
ncbi:MAG: hypothetical protein RLZZ519_3459 [Bacteroidota bacterium]